MVDDEIERLRSLLKNVHEQPRAIGLRRLADLVANRIIHKERTLESGKKEKSKKSAA
jgi:hypothetical protein